MRMISVGCFFVAALFCSSAANAQGDKALSALAQLSPEYKDYQRQALPLPVALPSLSLKVIGRVNRFAQNIGGYIGAVSLTEPEKQQAAKTFEEAVTTAISKEITLNENSRWRLVVVSGEGGGMVIGYGGYISCEIFLLDTKDKTLIGYTDDPEGRGATAYVALQDLAGDVSKKFKGMAKQTE